MPLSLYITRVDSEEPVRRGTRVIGYSRVSTYILCLYDGSTHTVTRLRFVDGVYRGGDVEKLRSILMECMERKEKVFYYSSRQLELLKEALKGLPKTMSLLEQMIREGLVEDLEKTRKVAPQAILAPVIVQVKKRDELESVEKNVEGGCVGASKIIYELLRAETTI